MSGLILKLSPFESVVINGVVVENGDRKSRLRIKTKDARILRLKGADEADDGSTPLARVAAMARNLSGGCETSPEIERSLARSIEEIALDPPAGVDAAALGEAALHAAQKRYYQASRILSRLRAAEREASGNSPPARA